MSVWGPERRALTIGLVLTITLFAFEALAVSTILPAIKDDLGGTALYGWVFSAFFLSSVVSTVVAGRAADQFGIGRPFAAGVVLFAIGLAMGAAAPSMIVLVASRVIQGLGGGAVSASAVTAVARGYPVHERPQVFALMSTAWVVPALIGPAISGVVADALGWRWVFAGLLPLIAVSGTIAYPRLRQLTPAVESTTSETALAAAVGLTVAVAALLVGLDHATSAAGLVGAVGGVVVAITMLRQLWPAGTLRAARGMPAAVVTKGALTFCFFGTDAFLALAVTSIHHRSVAYAGLPLTAAALTWTAGSWVTAHVAGTVPVRRVVAVGFTIIGVGIVATHIGLDATAPAAALIGGWAIAGFGMGLAFQTVTLAVVGAAPPGQEGKASAAQQLADLLGTATGTGVVGAVVAIGHTRHWTTASSLRIGFSLTLAVAVAGIALSRRLSAVARDALEAEAALD